MKFAKLTTPNGHAVYVCPWAIVSNTEHPITLGALIRTQMGQQEVNETPPQVVAALEAIE